MNKSPFSNDPLMSRECQAHAHLLGAYLDGELDAAKLLEIEGHVTRCETCRERVDLDRATRGTLKKVVREQAAAATTDRAAMRARMLGAMNGAKNRAEREAALSESRETAGLAAPAANWRATSSWRTMVPLTAAAALAIVWGSVAHTSSPRSGANVMAAGMPSDPLAGFVDMHRYTWPMECTDPKSCRNFEQYVGVPVRPSTFEKRGAHLVGGRLMPVRDQRAALLEYRLGEGGAAQRVSVFIYDPQKIQIGDSSMLQPRAIGTAQVRAGHVNGYSVAVTQKGGVGYTLASALDETDSAELAALADQD